MQAEATQAGTVLSVEAVAKAFGGNKARTPFVGVVYIRLCSGFRYRVRHRWRRVSGRDGHDGPPEKPCERQSLGVFFPAA